MLSYAIFLAKTVFLLGLSTYIPSIADLTVNAGSENTLYTTLFTKYNNNVRPQTNGFSQTQVSVTPTLFHLLSLNEAEQAIEFSIDITFTWNDPILTWDPTQYQGRSQIKVPESLIWQPDITLYSSTSKEDLIAYEQRLVIISSIGNVTKSGPQVVTNPCDMSLTQFPFDRQTCTFVLGPWSYTNTEVMLFLPKNDFPASDTFLGNTEWTFLGMTITKQEDDSYAEGEYDMVYFEIRLKRKSAYYVLALIVPTFVCASLTIFGLFIPTDLTGLRIEKATLGIASLLAMSLILETVTQNMPKSDVLPKLGTFVMAEVIICGVAMLVSCVFSFIHERVTTRRVRAPHFLQKIFLRRTYDRQVKQTDMGIQTKGDTWTRLSPLLHRIQQFIADCLADEKLSAIWQRIFDRIDLLAMILFEVGNVVMILIILLT